MKMQKDPKAICAQIDVALAQIETPIPADILDVFPMLENWRAISDHDIPLIHGVMTHALGGPQPILTAAVLAVESKHGLLVRCFDGCYRLGHPARFDSSLPYAGEGRKRGQISWTRLERLADALAFRLTRPDNDGGCET